MTVFKAITWSPSELVGEAKMDTLVSNSEFLFYNTPRALYTDAQSNITRVEGLKIASGRGIITARQEDTAGLTISFGNFFSSGCQPIITTGISANNEVAIFCVVNGISTEIPDNTGFQVEVNVATTNPANDRFVQSVYINWMAMGY
jgi:hypothetical protein